MCIGIIADKLGLDDIRDEYLGRSGNYKNLFDKNTGYLRSKDREGNFTEEFSPIAWGGDYTEASAIQTTLSPAHDVEGLCELYGGREGLLEYLDRLFDTPPVYEVGGYGRVIHEMEEMAACDLGQFAVSNQPSFHIPYFYSYLGEGEKCDKWVAKATDLYFSSAPDGFPGDEDNGSMSSWYIFSTLGFYPFCPGKAEYTLVKPKFKNPKIMGKTLKLKKHTGIISHKELLESFE
jgi:predicted alpha-1,2-mannosidase